MKERSVGGEGGRGVKKRSKEEECGRGVKKRSREEEHRRVASASSGAEHLLPPLHGPCSELALGIELACAADE